MAGGDARPTERKKKTEEGVLFFFQLGCRIRGNDGGGVSDFFLFQPPASISRFLFSGLPLIFGCRRGIGITMPAMPTGASDTPTLESLRTIVAFAPMPDDLLRSLARHCRLMHFARGETAFLQGEAASRFFAVCQGSFKLISTSPTGKEILLHLVLEGEVMGAVVAVQGRPYPATAVALRRSMVLEIPTAPFLRLTEDENLATEGLLKQVMTRVHESHALRTMQTERVETRLAHILLLLSGRDQAKGKWLLLTKEELATLAATTTETCIRVLSRWSKDGVIEAKRGRLRVLDNEALQALLQQG